MAQLGRAERLDAAIARDGGTCVWCGCAFDHRSRPTTEHVVPRVKGGPSWLENEVAACRRCNGERGHRGAVDWLEECLRRGWPFTNAFHTKFAEYMEARARIPAAWSWRVLRRFHARDARPGVFYFHPWEIDPGQPRAPGASRRARFRHTVNLGATAGRIDRLLRDFRWDRMDRVFAAELAG